MQKFAFLLTAFLLGIGLPVHAQRESIKVNENYWYNSTAARNLEARHELLITPLLADVTVKKVDGVERRAEFERTYYVDADYSRDDKDRLIDNLKKQALFDFCRDESADVIIGALISAQTVDEDGDGAVDRDGNRYKVIISITGYPANYTAFRKANREDYWIKEMLFRKTDDKNSEVTESNSGSVAKGTKTVSLN